jgi:hypothetical protein
MSWSLRTASHATVYAFRAPMLAHCLYCSFLSLCDAIFSVDMTRECHQRTATKRDKLISVKYATARVSFERYFVVRAS